MKISLTKRVYQVIFCFLVFLILLEIALRIAGYVYLSVQEHRNRKFIRQKREYRILCVGDSIGDWGGRDSYPYQLEEILNQRVRGIKFNVINKSLPGNNTTAILMRLEEDINKYNPDMVIAMMGLIDKEGDGLIYKDIPVVISTVNFLKSFRIYKLVNALYLSFKIRPQDTDKYKLAQKERNVMVEESIQIDDYKKQEKLSKEELEEVMRLSPLSDKAHIKLGWHYMDIAMDTNTIEFFDKAIQMFEKAIEINPQNDAAYVGLGDCYAEKARRKDTFELFLELFDKAIQMFEKAIEINPQNGQVYFDLGWCYKAVGKLEMAIMAFERGLEINPRNSLAYSAALGWCYRDQNKFDKAVELFQRIIEKDPENDKAYGALAFCYRQLGNYDLAEEYSRKAERLRREDYNPVTRYNYQRLKEIVTKRGIKLVCVQYPLHSVKPLMKILEPSSGIVFVDNEKVFEEALRQGKYEEYFSDISGGDFGHCTKKGSRLLAENIANTILKECFNIN